jgi:hypothetical protein
VSAIPQTSGAIAGALGTLALSALEPFRDALLGRPPVYAVRPLLTRAARRAWGIRLAPPAAQRWGLATRWVYGPTIGALYAALRPRLPASVRLGGLALGAAVGLFEAVSFPLLRVTPPRRQWSRGETLALGLQVLLFGVVTEAVLSRRRHAPRGPGPRPMGPADA